MPNISGIIKSLQNIMRKDQGVSGDAQRIEQLGWMITLKILDDKDAEMELLSDDYVSVIPEKLRWRAWAGDSEGITGDAMKEFVDSELFPGLQNLDVSDANAAWLTKNSNDSQVENILKRIHDSIYRTAACPDFSSESFVGGVSSGIAIRYRLTGMETRAAKIAAKMKKALQRRVEIICGVASLKLGEQIFRDIEIDFKRNIPSDNTEIVNLVNSLKGTVSDETLLGLLPFVDDVNKEVERLQKQKEANMALYNFGGASWWAKRGEFGRVCRDGAKCGLHHGRPKRQGEYRWHNAPW